MSASATRVEPSPGGPPTPGPCQLLWPFVGHSVDATVDGGHGPAREGGSKAIVLVGTELPPDWRALRVRILAAGARLAPDGSLALLADNAWRAALARQASGQPSPIAIYSALRAAGLRQLRWYAVSPSARTPTMVRPASPVQASLAPALLITASATGASSTACALDRIVMHAVATGAVPANVRPLQVICSDKDKVLVFLGTRRAHWLVRVPTAEASLRAERHAHALLRQLGAAPLLAPLLPRPVQEIDVDGQPALVETMLGGRPLAGQLDARTRPRFAGEAARFLESLNPSPAAACDALMARFARPLLDRLAPHLPDAAMLAPLHDVLERMLAGVRCRLGVVHGDFGTKNILAEAGRIVGVVDWENAQPQAPIVLDRMGYLDSAERRVNRGQSLVDTLPRIAAGTWTEPTESATLSRELAAGGANASALPGLALLYWLAHVTPQLGYGTAGPAERERLEQVLRWALVAGTAHRPSFA